VPDVVLKVVSRIDKDWFLSTGLSSSGTSTSLVPTLSFWTRSHPVDAAFIRMAEPHDSAAVAVNALDGISVGVGPRLQ
jgi:hypothetical protein